jgi:hypothetical protein
MWVTIILATTNNHVQHHRIYKHSLVAKVATIATVAIHCCQWISGDSWQLVDNGALCYLFRYGGITMVDISH